MLPHIDYDFDVEGDVILTLEEPNKPFAVWFGEDAPRASDLPRVSEPVLDDEVLRKFRRNDPAWKGALVPPNSGQHQPIDPEGVISEQARVGDEESEEVAPIRFRLSSRHLISASPYFRAILTGPWEESSSRADVGYKLSATDWDESAFKLLMDIIHGNSQNVPRCIDLELLAKVAVLVDYYKCYDVVRFYSDAWIEGLGDEMEINYYSREFVLLLFVSCVFFLDTPFRNLTYEAIRQTKGPLQSLGLPFPEGPLIVAQKLATRSWSAYCTVQCLREASSARGQHAPLMDSVSQRSLALVWHGIPDTRRAVDGMKDFRILIRIVHAELKVSSSPS
ncbi:hypothetical protein DHEL01_v201903 [Diaporthe helianthi]|uniref:Uncharacterized protein n=1 Tax=Diaporthe helianthi TaxID=158607 RepID=A0A2P5IB84_DIAHE|nr:hypothetical protein DHEL01_v201903 [Diaporthe helianthi]